MSIGLWRRVLDAIASIQLGLVLLLPLHSPVLEPNLDLTLSQAEGMSNLDPSPTGQVAVEVELLLKFQGLISGVRLTAAFSLWGRDKGY